jgi:threonyl-tRNA synthetase
MIHRAILGSLERFFGVLIEHYAGDFPLWLAPIQARILPVTDNELQYCNEVASELKSKGIRAEVCHGERLPKLIRNAETKKVPLMAVVGPKEVQARTLTIRSRHSGEIGTMPVDEFFRRIQLAIANKSSSL